MLQLLECIFFHRRGKLPPIQDAIAIQMGEGTRRAPTTTLKIDDPFPARRPALLLVVVAVVFFMYEKAWGG